MEENERIDDLQYKGLKIIQNKDGFCFGIDSILLADFAKEIKKGSSVIDLGTGTGIIGILLCAKIQLKEMVGVEIQKEVYQMAKKSIEMNQMQDKFTLLNTNIKELKIKLPAASFDAVVSNPPYKKMNTGLTNENVKKLISRHEILADLEDFIQTAFILLKDKKDFFLIHRPERLTDILTLLRKHKLEPKRIRFVHPKIGKQANLVLIKATKNAKPFLKIEPPLFVYGENGEYTKEILQIYGKE